MAYRLVLFASACILAKAVSPAGTLAPWFWWFIVPVAVLVYILDFTELGNRL